MFDKLTPPSSGTRIEFAGGELKIPDRPIIPCIEGDGIGPDIMRATHIVLNGAVEKAYKGKKQIVWMEVYAGEKAQAQYGESLPQDTLKAISHYRVALKGPLTTPVGGGFRSLNVSLRQLLDLYACVRPVRYFEGVPSPVKHPERMNVIIYRENTEDIYAGIEWKQGTPEVRKLIDFLNQEMGKNIRADSGVGIKPISVFCSKRLARMAIQYAIRHQKDSVTLVHKGNIQKFTEGAFKDWGYEVAAQEFGDKTIPEEQVAGKTDGKVVIKDRIADSMFQQILTRTGEYSVIATTNLNGDYLSDACAAQVGGLGLAPGANIGDEVALFEATHGTAPKYAGKDQVNPGSLILSGVMMLEHLGWQAAAELVISGMEKTIKAKTVTYDLERMMEGAKLLKCSEFGKAIVANM